MPRHFGLYVIGILHLDQVLPSLLAFSYHSSKFKNFVTSPTKDNLKLLQHVTLHMLFWYNVHLDYAVLTHPNTKVLSCNLIDSGSKCYTTRTNNIKLSLRIFFFRRLQLEQMACQRIMNNNYHVCRLKRRNNEQQLPKFPPNRKHTLTRTDLAQPVSNSRIKTYKFHRVIFPQIQILLFGHNNNSPQEKNMWAVPLIISINLMQILLSAEQYSINLHQNLSTIKYHPNSQPANNICIEVIEKQISKRKKSNNAKTSANKHHPTNNYSVIARKKYTIWQYAHSDSKHQYWTYIYIYSKNNIK